MKNLNVSRQVHVFHFNGCVIRKYSKLQKKPTKVVNLHINKKSFIVLTLSDNDCPDASDETNCNRNTTCDPWMFSCGDGKCIYKTWACKLFLIQKFILNKL